MPIENLINEFVLVLKAQPLLLLFVIIAIGFPLGRLNIKGFSLGVAAILFSGLAIGSLDPELKLPEVVYLFGLVLFVYTIGISTGETFFQSFRKNGLVENLLASGVIFFVFLLFMLFYRYSNIHTTLLAGMFAGTLTNTPALAQLLDYLKILKDIPYGHDALFEPVIAYSICYPMGVVGMIMAILSFQNILKVNYSKENSDPDEEQGGGHLENRSIQVENDLNGQNIKTWVEANNFTIVCSRIFREGKYWVAKPTSLLEKGDIVAVVGKSEELDAVTKFLGKESTINITHNHSMLDYRRIFVSNPDVIGRKISDLDTLYKMGAIITRIRRGDSDIVPSPDLHLLPGDRVRVLYHRADAEKITKFFGDSYRQISEIDVLTFSMGIALGILVGMIPLYKSDTLTLKLGVAGGPLIVALILGYFGRTGKMNWTLPYSANLTLRQIGIILFLAGVGSRAGYTFVHTFSKEGTGWLMFGYGALITFMAAIIFLSVGYYLLKIPWSRLTGMLAGMQTQPALLGFACEQAKNDRPNEGYASVYPVSTILKIILAQVLLSMGI